MNVYLRGLITIYNKEKKGVINNLYEKLNSGLTKEEKCIVGQSIVLKYMELPDLVFSTTLLSILSIQLGNYDYQDDDSVFIQRKTSETLDILLRGYQLSDDEINLIHSVSDSKRKEIDDKVELHIYDMKREHVSCYLRKQLLPYWKDILSEECIKYVNQLNDKTVIKMNKFIPVQDMLNEIYFVDNRPEDWREKLDELGINYD